MAISFAGSDYLSVSDSGISNETILITAWGYIDSDNGVTNALAWSANSAGDGGFGLTAAMGATNNPTRASKYNASGGTSPASLNTTPTATWFAAAAYFESNTSRYAYRAGTRSAQSTNSVLDPAPDTLSIGARVNSTVADYLTGRAAEVAIYTGITLAEADAIHAAHADGFSPLLCPRADAIYEYWPLVNAANLQGVIRGLTLSATGSPTSVAHPRIIRPSARIYSFPSSAAAGAYTIAAASGAYNYTGTASALTAQRALAAASGAYTYGGTATAITLARTIAAGSGTYSYVGTAADIIAARIIAAASGAYSYSGTAADIIYTPIGGYTLAADAGSYVYTGTVADITAARVIAAASGGYSYAGTDADILHGHVIDAGSGTYIVTGTAAALLRDAVLAGGAGAYTYTGTEITLSYSGATVILSPGLEFTAPTAREHYTAPTAREHYTAPTAREHYTAALN